MLRNLTTFKCKIQYISNCIRSTKFYYQHNANIMFSSVHLDQRMFVTNTDFYKKNFTIYTTSNIKKYMYSVM